MPSARAYVEILVAVVVDVARHYAGAIAVFGGDARLGAYFGERAVAIVAEQEVGAQLLLRYVEVLVAIPVVVEYGYARIAVDGEGVVSQRIGGDVREERGVIAAGGAWQRRESAASH